MFIVNNNHGKGHEADLSNIKGDIGFGFGHYTDIDGRLIPGHGHYSEDRGGLFDGMALSMEFLGHYYSSVSKRNGRESIE